MRIWPWLVTISFALGWACARPRQTSTPPRPILTSQANSPAVAPSPFPELSGDQAWAAYRAGTLFLDARPGMDYWQGHIPGALSLPFWAKDFESLLLDFITSPRGDPSIPVVVYCGGCCSTDSLMLARRLQDFGFNRIQIYRDGYPGWARAERPIETGAAPKRIVVE